MAKKITKAVIPVAGHGTRLLPASKAIPKELLPVFDRPIIEHVVEEAIAGGVTEIILVTRSGKEAIENHFDAHFELEHRLEISGRNKELEAIKDVIPENVKISSVRQRDALGLGHAVLCARHLLAGEPFAVLLPDVLVLDQEFKGRNYSFAKLVQAWEESGKGQILVQSVEPDSVEDYGIADLDCSEVKLFESQMVKGLVEKPSPKNAPSDLAIVGRYVLPFRIIELLENTAPGIGGEIQLTDALNAVLDGEGIAALKTDAQVFDCGNTLGLLFANLAVGLRDPAAQKAIIDSLGQSGWSRSA